MLQHVQDRVIVKINRDEKNHHTFGDGTQIRLERDRDNLDQKYTKISQGIVVSGDGIPTGAEILMHHHVSHDTYRIFNYTTLSGKEIAEDTFYYSIPETLCYLWRIGDGEWQPMKGYATALRVFHPYVGPIEGIDPTLVPNVLFMTSGEYKGKVVVTIRAADYEIIFQDTNGRESRVIRCRPDGDAKTQREAEVVAIHHLYTGMVKDGRLLIGLSKSDATLIENTPHYAR